MHQCDTNEVDFHKQITTKAIAREISAEAVRQHSETAINVLQYLPTDKTSRRMIS